jgi:beta-lactamase superfamily II metal-dependent hydrolase
MSLRFSPKSAIIAATASAIVAGVGAYVWHQEHRLPLLDIYLFALKSGQSAFIRTPDDRRILVNGGSNSEIIRRISKRLPFYSRRIDALIVTDTSAKNVSGLIDVLERYAG